MKTLAELWREQGGPFWAKGHDGSVFHCVGLDPIQKKFLICWPQGKDESVISHFDQDITGFILTDDPTKEQERLRVWRNDRTGIVHFASECDAEFETDITADLAAALWPHFKKRLEQE